jgi:hypothetical protein
MRGEVRFSAAGGARALRFTTNRICALEDNTGRRIQDFAAAVSDEATFSVRDLRTLLAFGCDVSEAVAGDIIDDLSIRGVADLVGRALALAFDGVEQPEAAAAAVDARGKRAAAAK